MHANTCIHENSLSSSTTVFKLNKPNKKLPHEEQCGSRLLCTVRMLCDFHCLLPTEKADEIPGPVTHEIMNGEPSSVFIKWNTPRSPNGLIILYEVFYRKVGDTEVSTNHHTTF